MTRGHFRLTKDIASQPLPFGSLKWLCHPASTEAKQLAIIEATLNAGEGHAFHLHPNQEEVIYVTSGLVEQWIGEDKRVLAPGDCAFIPAGTVHASFTVSEGPAKLLAIFGPCVGEGFTTVEVGGEAPWKDLRQAA